MSPWEEVGDHAFVRRYPYADQTIGAIVGGDGVAVLDTRSTYRQADELRADLRQLTSLPVAYVVNTHGHYDHAFGNARFLPTPIWGHVRCAEMVRQTGELQRRRLIAMEPELASELAEVELVPPDELFDASATLDLGDLTIELRYLGRGHTDNDIVTLAGDVLFAGDLLENGAPPYFGDGYPIAWAETGRRLLDLVRGSVVPGHGDPADRAFAERQVAEIGELAELARHVATGTFGLDEAMRRSPYPDGPTREALDRGALELAAVIGTESIDSGQQDSPAEGH